MDGAGIGAGGFAVALLPCPTGNYLPRMPARRRGLLDPGAALH